MTGHTIRHIIITVVFALVIAYSFMISLYRYEWEPLLKEVNTQGILILKVFYAVMMVVLGIAIYLTVKSKTKFKFVYMLLMAIVCVRMAIVLSI